MAKDSLGEIVNPIGEETPQTEVKAPVAIVTNQGRTKTATATRKTEYQGFFYKEVLTENKPTGGNFHIKGQALYYVSERYNHNIKLSGVTHDNRAIEVYFNYNELPESMEQMVADLLAAPKNTIQLTAIVPFENRIADKTTFTPDGLGKILCHTTTGVSPRNIFSYLMDKVFEDMHRMYLETMPKKSEIFDFKQMQVDILLHPEKYTAEQKATAMELLKSW